MKKIVLSLLGLFSAFAVSAQTPQFVSTEPANKNVIIEEYTGINCGYCPDGHKRVREYEAANPGRVFGINIHAGSYAANTYTTQWGNALMNQAQVTGFPSGTINRETFTYYDDYYGQTVTSMALGRGQFVSCGNEILAQTSFVNVAAQASIDATTRTMTVNVEAYYTADAETASNKLNVVLVQDSIIGPQSGASGNPSQVTSDGQYIHMSMLRDMLTGQWGDDITAPEGSTVIPAGTLIQRTYTYNIPGSISNELVKLGHLRLIVFVAKDTKEIYTGSECIPTVTNLPELAAMSTTMSAQGQNGCNDLASLALKVYNTGANAITTMQIAYGSAVSGEQTFDWTGSITSDQEVFVELPEVPVTVGQNTNVFANIVSINGTAISDEQKTATIKKDAPKEGNGDKLKIIIKTDQYAYECSWKLSDGNGNVLEEADYYPQQVVVRDTVEVPLTETGCYVFEIFDEYGDGGTTYKIYDGSETRLVNGTGSSYDDYKAIDIKILSLVGLEEAEGAILQTLAYPNPVNDMLNLEISMLESTHANISVVDMLGREVISLGEVALATGNNKFEINTSNLSNGAYFVKIISNSGITSKKISVNR
ncbi:MAG: Omp28-related outer membrane protein [Bacteroidales bacterium]|nr:Omp28-related outer membrane protein [Bacteroidales bacterium]